MDDVSLDVGHSAAARQQSLALEGDDNARALRSVAEGRVVSADAVNAWIDSLDSDQELPVPRSGR